MGKEWVNKAISALSEAGIRAASGFPGESKTTMEETVAAVNITGFDGDTGKMTVTVLILTPRKLGLGECQGTAIDASLALTDVGIGCSFDRWTYDETLDCFSIALVGEVPYAGTDQENTMKYKVFTWPNNPDTFKIRVIREPEYSIDENGRYHYTGLGPLCREFTGTGTFYGTLASQNFNTLQVIMANGTSGELVHPVWGTIDAFLTGLEVIQDARPDHVEIGRAHV